MFFGLLYPLSCLVHYMIVRQPCHLNLLSWSWFNPLPPLPLVESCCLANSSIWTVACHLSSIHVQCMPLMWHVMAACALAFKILTSICSPLTFAILSRGFSEFSMFSVRSLALVRRFSIRPYQTYQLRVVLAFSCGLRCEPLWQDQQLGLMQHATCHDMSLPLCTRALVIHTLYLVFFWCHKWYWVILYFEHFGHFSSLIGLVAHGQSRYK